VAVNSGGWRGGKEVEAGEVVPIPACLLLDHGTERLEPEGLTGAVEGDRDAAAVRMRVDAMSAVVAAEAKAVSQQRRNDFTRSEGAKTGIVERAAVRR
jgi:hypothetical protein